jgi:hypothetical protein
VARGEDTRHHPNRQVSKERFGVGDIVHMPGHSPVTVQSMDRRYFTGLTSTGTRIGQTGIGLAAGEGGLGKPGSPWRVERRG